MYEFILYIFFIIIIIILQLFRIGWTANEAERKRGDNMLDFNQGCYKDSALYMGRTLYQVSMNENFNCITLWISCF